MHWEVLLVLLVPLAVWILSTIFSGAEEERHKQRLKRSAEEGTRTKVPRRPVQDLDRQLAESRRQREAPPRRPRSANLPEAATPMTGQRIPVALPVNSPAAPTGVSPPPQRRPRELPKPRPSTPEAPRPTPAEPLVPVRLAEALPALPVASVPGSIPTAAGARWVPSPFLEQLTGLLQNRTTLATAMVLKEIFDRPVSQRRR